MIDHPIRKKYTRDQIASLMYIAVSKTVLSIENIDTLFKMQREHCSAGTAYDIFCEELEASLSVVFGSKAAQPETTLNDERLLLRSTILPRSTKYIWTAASMPCGRSRHCGRISCRIWRNRTARNSRYNKSHPKTYVFRWLFSGGGDGSRTHVRKELSVGISGCRRSTTFPPRHADRQASALVAS